MYYQRRGMGVEQQTCKRLSAATRERPDERKCKQPQTKYLEIFGKIVILWQNQRVTLYRLSLHPEWKWNMLGRVVRGRAQRWNKLHARNNVRPKILTG